MNLADHPDTTDLQTIMTDRIYHVLIIIDRMLYLLDNSYSLELASYLKFVELYGCLIRLLERYFWFHEYFEDLVNGESVADILAKQQDSVCMFTLPKVLTPDDVYVRNIYGSVDIIDPFNHIEPERIIPNVWIWDEYTEKIQLAISSEQIFCANIGFLKALVSRFHNLLADDIVYLSPR